MHRWDFSSYSQISGFRFLSENSKNGAEVHFFRIQTLSWSHPCTCQTSLKRQLRRFDWYVASAHCMYVFSYYIVHWKLITCLGVSFIVDCFQHSGHGVLSWWGFRISAKGWTSTWPSTSSATHRRKTCGRPWRRPAGNLWAQWWPPGPHRKASLCSR